MIRVTIGLTLLALWVLVMPEVTTLPWGIDEPLLFFMIRINDLMYVMPWLETVWNVFIIGVSVKIAVFIFKWTIRAYTLIVG